MEKIKFIEVPKAVSVNAPEKIDNACECVEPSANDLFEGSRTNMKYFYTVFGFAARAFLDTPEALLDSQCPHLW